MDTTKSDNSTDKTPFFMDEELGEFEFKPITEGLGFKKNKVRKETSFPSKKIQTTLKRARSPLNENPQYRKPMGSQTLTQRPISRPRTEPRAAVPAPIVQEVSTSRRFGAWLLDTVLVVTLCACVLFPLSLIQGLGFQKIAGFFSPGELALVGSSLILSVHFLYHFIGELVSSGTFGKKLFRIQLEKDNTKQGRQKVLIYNLAALISLIFLGLPILGRLPENLSGLRVIERP